jgi:ankyrin repeat protein
MSSRRGDVPLSREEARGLLLPSLDSLGIHIGALTYQDMDKEDREADKLFDACVYDNAADVKRLLEAGTDVNAMIDDGGRAPLHVACENGSAECVALLLERNAYVEKRDDDDATPLQYACLRGHVDCARLVLQSGADANTKDGLRRTPLQRACMAGQVDCQRVLLKYGANVNERGNRRRTALHVACEYHNVACARLLLQYGADVSTKDPRGRTALHVACHSNSLPCTKLLLEHGADANVRDNHQETPMHYACENDYAEHATLLLKAGATIDWAPFAGCYALLSRVKLAPAADGRVPLGWTADRHALFHREERALLEGALRKLLLAEARRAGCALGEDAVESVLRAVVA